jgi:hypothetical protein
VLIIGNYSETFDDDPGPHLPKGSHHRTSALILSFKIIILTPAYIRIDFRGAPSVGAADGHYPQRITTTIQSKEIAVATNSEKSVNPIQAR